MKLHSGLPLYSATDLLNFLGCAHASALDIQVLGGTLDKPAEDDDPYHALLSAKGTEHEQRCLETFRAEGKSVVEITDELPLEEKVERTLEAMRAGADVIYQGTLFAPGWHGYSDFLLRVDTPSALGDWSYEVLDAKLARTARPKNIVQLCVYSELVALVQNELPKHAHVLLGDGSKVTLRVNDFIYYFNRLRERFGRFTTNGSGGTVAEPCGHCEMCRWSERCDAEWQAMGHLRLVAGLGSPQARKLRAQGIETMGQLAQLDTGTRVPRIQDSTLEKLRRQAQLQVGKQSSGTNRYEILPPLADRGFSRLPQPNEGDLFFDIEGDPLYSPKGSLEYLFGFHYVDAGEDRYKAFWARDRSEEKKAFEDALDFITDRLARYPAAYIYHYASYEPLVLRRLAREYGSSSNEEEALKRLAQSYGTRENEVDDLLRNQKLVDLYKVAREAVQTSEPSYSLKNLEVFFAPERTQEITSGGDSVVAFENWLKIRDDKILDRIADYNEFDCISTRLCRDWLVGLKPAGVPWLDPDLERTAAQEEKEKERREKDRLVYALRANLTVNTEGEERRWRELLGYLLEYHRREARSEWWRFFKRLKPEADLLNDAECIADATVDTSVPERIEKRSKVVRLRFPEQDFKLKVGKTPVRTDTKGSAGRIVGLNEEERWLEILVGPSKPAFGETVSLVPEGPVRDETMREALFRFGLAVFEGKSEDYPAVMSILRKERPRLRDSVIMRYADPLAGTVDAIDRMDHTHLVIQGPPGTGKTFTSAHAIVALLDAGKTVGVMSQGHKAINNLLRTVEEVAAKQGVTFKGIKRSNDEDQNLNSSVIADSKRNEDVFEGDYHLIGGTAWLFSCDEMEKKLDYLFIDEAGQVSLADVVASGLSAHNIVLVGDQMQLPQVAQGLHPGGSGVSGLDYLTGDWATVPADRGIFLPETRRLHPQLCTFISDAFYEGRLKPHSSTDEQMIEIHGPADDALLQFGLSFVVVDHAGNAQKSIEEADRLAAAYQSLMGRVWINQHGEARRIGTDDILVVSPYNMQVNLLRSRLPAGARVGTVDKFQGQEAAAVLVSMASSSADDAPRGIDFLFSRNRLNVALSRARCLSVIYCSPALLDVVCTDVERMKLVNTVCWAKEYGEIAMP